MRPVWTGQENLAPIGVRFPESPIRRGRCILHSCEQDLMLLVS